MGLPAGAMTGAIRLMTEPPYSLDQDLGPFQKFLKYHDQPPLLRFPANGLYIHGI